MGKSTTRGVLVFRRNGKAHVEVGEHRKYVQLAQSGIGTALHGDEVEIRPVARKKVIDENSEALKDRVTTWSRYSLAL